MSSISRRAQRADGLVGRWGSSLEGGSRPLVLKTGRPLSLLHLRYLVPCPIADHRRASQETGKRLSLKAPRVSVGRTPISLCSIVGYARSGRKSMGTIRRWARELADLAGEDPLQGAADRHLLRKFRARTDRGAGIQGDAPSRSDPLGNSAAAGSQSLRQARHPRRCADAFPKGLETADFRARPTEPTALRNRRFRYAAGQAALRRCPGRAIFELPPLRQLSAAGGGRAGDRGRAGPARVNSVRSCRPNSRSAAARPFCRG
jgi:hypothetical protein